MTWWNVPELSVIVPSLQSRDETLCVKCLERGSFSDYEVIVREDPGASRARNAGIEEATADKLVFLDDDSCPTVGYLERAAEVLDDHAAVTGRIVHPADDIFAEFTQGYDFGDALRPVNTLVGCNMALRREVFDVIGPFDEDLVWGHEEAELAHRVSKAYDIMYDPDLVVRHPYAESVVGLWKKKYREGSQRPLYLQKTDTPLAEQILLFGRSLFTARYRGDSIWETGVYTGASLARHLGILRGFTIQLRSAG